MENGNTAEPTVASPTGTAYSVTCNEGYELVGDTTGSLICDKDNKWITTKPSCERKVYFILFPFKIFYSTHTLNCIRLPCIL